MCEHCKELTDLPDDEYRLQTLDVILDHRKSIDVCMRAMVQFSELSDDQASEIARLDGIAHASIQMAALQAGEILILKETLSNLQEAVVLLLDPSTDMTALASKLATLSTVRFAMTSDALAPEMWSTEGNTNA